MPFGGGNSAWKRIRIGDQTSLAPTDGLESGEIRHDHKDGASPRLERGTSHQAFLPPLDGPASGRSVVWSLPDLIRGNSTHRLGNPT